MDLVYVILKTGSDSVSLCATWLGGGVKVHHIIKNFYTYGNEITRISLRLIQISEATKASLESYQIEASISWKENLKQNYFIK